MGVLRFFVPVVRALDANPLSAATDGLDEIAASAEGFSYIGNRKTLSSLVRQEAGELLERLCAIPDKRLMALKDTEPALVEAVRSIKSKARHREFDLVGDWLGRH